MAMQALQVRGRTERDGGGGWRLRIGLVSEIRRIQRSWPGRRILYRRPQRALSRQGRGLLERRCGESRVRHALSERGRREARHVQTVTQLPRVAALHLGQ